MPVLVRDLTLGDPLAVVEAQAAGAYELLIELSALPGEGEGVSARLGAALGRVGDGSGEVWLHLLGLATEAPAPRDAAALLAHLEATDPLEVRRQLLGVDVPAWRRLVGPEVIEAAAAGDRAAQARLLEHPRYYGGAARQALAVLLPLGPAETRLRLLEVLGRWHQESFGAREAHLVEALAADAQATTELAATVPPARLIELVCGGFAYEPEPECPRVLLVPHLAARPWLLLCQHRDTRIICHPARHQSTDERAATAEGLLRLGRALGDEQRQRILAALAGGAQLELDELAGVVGLSRSTVHHHLALLRAAGLVRLAGNARRYRYGLRREAVAEATALLASLLTAPGEERP